MDTSVFTQIPEVRASIDKGAGAINRRRTSDVVDDEGHQYIDIVLEGGGVLGVALVGYTYALEAMGIRFLSIGGTSAGAINALMLAAADKPKDMRSEAMIEKLVKIDMASFVDGNWAARRLTRKISTGASFAQSLGYAALLIRKLFSRHGIHPGDAFERWVEGVLFDFGVNTTKDLRAKMREQPAGLRHDAEGGGPIDLADDPPSLGIVAANVTTETKAVFPECASLYWSDPDALNPAAFVRASMSIPLFFYPCRVGPIPQNPEDWEKLVRFDGDLPDHVLFVDGGIMSNFPIDLFHRNAIPRRPTFGAKLGSRRRQKQETSPLKKFLAAVFNAARHYGDFNFLIKNREYDQLVGYIPTRDVNWLDFEMPLETQQLLFTRGAVEAARFVEAFDWPAYLKVREADLKAIKH